MARPADGTGKTGSEDLARVLRERRAELGLSRQELADATGIPYPTIAQIETAYRGASPSRLGVIARVLGLDPKDLFDVLASAGAAEAALPWHANPRFAALPASKAAGSAAPMAAPAPDARSSPRRRRPAPKADVAAGTGEVVDHVVELLSQLPADARIEALGQVQGRLLERIVEERIERDD